MTAKIVSVLAQPLPKLGSVSSTVVPVIESAQV